MANYIIVSLGSIGPHLTGRAKHLDVARSWLNCKLLLLHVTKQKSECSRLFLHAFVCYLQHTSLSPDGKLLTIVGDNPDGMLVDSQTGKVLFLFNFLSARLVNIHLSLL